MDTASPPTRLIVPLTASDPAAMRADMLLAAGLGADIVECRLDMLASPPSEEALRGLLANAPVPVIATNRPARQGGLYRGEERDRLDLLRRCAELGADWIDVESDTPADNRPAGRTILSQHDFSGSTKGLDATADALEASPAEVNKVAFVAAGPEDALLAFDILRRCRKPTIAIAMGEAGVASRLLAAKFGAFATFASLREGAESAPGQFTIQQFTSLYRWGRVGPDTAVYGVVGCPVGHSMSPAIHNAAFAATGIDAVYVPLLVEDGQASFNRFMDALLARPWLGWRGLSVTLPHKENALAYVGPANCDELTLRIGAVNTVTIEPDGRLRGTNSDYASALDALCGVMGIDRRGLAGRSVAIIGAGGAARAIVAGLVHYGASVVIYNRTAARAQALAAEFLCGAAALDEAPLTEAEILINCTPVGMYPEADASPLRRIPPLAKIVFDTIYNPPETALLRQAKAAGCAAVSGLDMFVHQAAAQFGTWTGTAAPREVMRDVVVRLLGA